MFFDSLCATVAAERIVELIWSRRRTPSMRERAWPAMVALHAGTLVAAPLESRVSRVPKWLSRAALITFAGATMLRVWTLRTLGKNWNVRVLRPGNIVTRGPYGFIRHPNYLAVILELASLPLIGGAWITSLAATLANALLLSKRIPFEEKLLFSQRAYRRHFAALPRLLPW
jgi:methyltransferase